MTASQRWQVLEEESGARLDRFLADHVPSLSRVQARRLVEDGFVVVAGHTAKPARVLEAGDDVLLRDYAELEVPVVMAAPGVALDVLYADDAVVVIDKPSGLVSHPGAGRETVSVAGALVARFPELAQRFGGERPGIVHRLDRDTSGVMVAALTVGAAEVLIGQFARGEVEKVYLALVWGVPDPAEAVIDAPIGRDPRQRQRMAAHDRGKTALTRYKVLSAGDTLSLVEVRPMTGRTHQIRVHLTAIGYPVAGDTVYGRRGKTRQSVVSRLALHAWRLSFVHPISGERLAFSASPPPDFVAAAHNAGLALPA